VDKQGRIYAVQPQSGLWRQWEMELYLVAPHGAVKELDEIGFISLLFNDEWDSAVPSTQFFFLYWGATGEHDGRPAGMRISRFDHRPPGPGGDEISVRGTWSSERVIWTDTDGFPSTAHVDGRNEGVPRGVSRLWHYGGELQWGPDGRIYIALGDKYRTDMARSNTSYSGCVLRIDRDGSIPVGNLAPGVKPPECWAHGIRNGYRAFWDLEPVGRERYFIADVGANERAWAREDLYYGRQGVHYGWPHCILGLGFF